MKGWTIQPLGWVVVVIVAALTLFWVTRWLQTLPPHSQDK